MTSSSLEPTRSLDPRVLAGLNDLVLAARTVVDGFMFGVHPSRTRGPGLEFSQYRSYEPGDDPRRLDWKLYGRSDRYFVRESETETSLTVRLVLDASRSMAHEEDGLTKFDYARLVTAALALLAERQGDAVGLVALTDERLVTLPPQRGHQHMGRLLHQLEDLEPQGRFPPWREAEAAVNDGGGRGLTVVISDFHEREHEILDFVRRVSALRHETLVIHIQGPRERDFDWQGAVSFEDLETGNRIEVEAASARAAYLEAQEQSFGRLRRELQDRGVRYGVMMMDQPIDQALRQFLVTQEGRR
jgi:uncharacterized protein (DUF58 family)